MFLGVFRSCMGKEVDSEVRLLLLLLWALGLRYSSALAFFECTRPPRHGSNVDALVASIVPNLDICDASRATLRTARMGVRVSALCARICFVDESMPSRACHSVCLRDFDNLCYQLSRSISRPRGPFIIRKMVALCNIQLPVVH